MKILLICQITAIYLSNKDFANFVKRKLLIYQVDIFANLSEKISLTCPMKTAKYQMKTC